MKTMLRIEKLTKNFGQMRALDGCSFEVARGSITGIIGPNGSGKSTLFNIISGLLKASEGNIFFDSPQGAIRLNSKRSFEIARLGIGRTFQLNRVFKRLSVVENLLAVRLDRARALALLEFVGLIELKELLAGHLSIGQQRLLEIARALMLHPQLVLLDEPTAGVNPVMIEKLSDYIQKTQSEFGTTFLIIEHHLPFLLGLSHHMIVLNAGQKIAEGAPQQIRTDPRVIEAYLGSAQ